MDYYDFAVVGNSLAAMVAARELAAGGNRVCLWNPLPAWGAHFGGLELNGRKFDLGMNLLEFTSFAAQSTAVETYDCERRNDLARFTTVIGEYIRGLLDCAVTATPQSVLGGRVAGDIVISNQLDLLDGLEAAAKFQMESELVACLDNFQSAPALHARHKSTAARLFIETSYRAVSEANHGALFHRLIIEEICRKTLGLGSDRMMALFHRAAWAPLYYPESLLARLRGQPGSFPATKFSYPRSGSFQAVIGALLVRLDETPGVTLERGKLDRIKRVESGYELGQAVACRRLVWGLRSEQLLSCLGEPEQPGPTDKTSVHIAFVTAATADLAAPFSTRFILDPGEPVYRITNQTHSAGQDKAESVLSIELSAAELAAQPAAETTALGATLPQRLARLGVLADPRSCRVQAVKFLKDALVAPTNENHRRAEVARARAREILATDELIGAAAPYGANTFNDNVAQGLKLGRIHARNQTRKFRAHH